tara:strand:+ start:3350 stop:3931 length:582 start_codon:yes stop_codon:yes gene_type:complete
MATTILSGTAMAQGATNGLVIGGQIGYAKFVPWSKIYGHLNNGGAYLGGILGYNFALNKKLSIGLETGINYGNRMSKGFPAGVEVHTNLLNIPIMAVINYYPTGNGFNIFIKNGVAYNRQEEISSDTSQISSVTTSQWRYIAAAGIGYQIQNFNVFTQYTYLFAKKWNDASSSDTNTNAMNAWTAGITYTIPM